MSSDDGVKRLVLTRRLGQGCVIYHPSGAAQEVIVHEIRPNSVRLMFQDLEHAAAMRVWRSEIFDEREERGVND